MFVFRWSLWLLALVSLRTALCALLEPSSWRLIATNSSTESIGFYSTSRDAFKCPSVPCVGGKDLYRNTSFHLVFSAEHVSSFPLLVNRVCLAMQQCIPQGNFLLTLHSTLNVLELVERPGYQQITGFLGAIGASFSKDDRVFTANNKMMVSLEQLHHLHDENKLIYHTDLDEVPEQTQLDQAMRELRAGRCDAIRGQWRERVALDGSPTDISLSQAVPLTQQFPYSCEISAAYMPIRTTWKVLVYRSLYRLVSGQHEIWCNNHRPTHENKGSKKREKGAPRMASLCRTHVAQRVDKTTPINEIMAQLRTPPSLPRFCPTNVTINHFKFVRGVVEELEKRSAAYKKLNLAWYSQSANIVNHIKRNKGRLCVRCKDFNCRLVTKKSTRMLAPD